MLTHFSFILHKQRILTYFHCKSHTMTTIPEGWMGIISTRHYATNVVNRALLTSSFTQNVPLTCTCVFWVPPVTPHLSGFYCTGHLKDDLVRGPYPLYLKGLSRKWPLQRRTQADAQLSSQQLRSELLTLHFQGQQISALVHWPSGTPALFFCGSNVDTSTQL